MTPVGAPIRSVVVFAIATVLTVGVLREIDRGAGALRACDSAIKQGKRTEAIFAARGAAEAMVPFSPHSKAGFARLRTIADDAEARGDEDTASGAWRAMRTAALATRSPFSRHDEWLVQANDGIVRVAGLRSGPADPGRAKVDAVAIRESLDARLLPTRATFVALAIGAIAFFSGLAAWAAGPSLSLGLARSRIALAAALLGLAVYLIAGYSA